MYRLFVGLIKLKLDLLFNALVLYLFVPRPTSAAVGFAAWAFVT